MEEQNKKQKDSAMKRILILSYYPVQIFLALLGIVLGFASWSLLELMGYEMLGKPDLHHYAIPLILAIAFVRLHRYWVFKYKNSEGCGSDDGDNSAQ